MLPGELTRRFFGAQRSYASPAIQAASRPIAVPITSSNSATAIQWQCLRLAMEKEARDPH
jgi:maleate cis-trans isomerase